MFGSLFKYSFYGMVAVIALNTVSFITTHAYGELFQLVGGDHLVAIPVALAVAFFVLSTVFVSLMKPMVDPTTNAVWENVGFATTTSLLAVVVLTVAGYFIWL